MRMKTLAGVATALLSASTLAAQGQAPAPSNLQAPNDPRYADVIAKCKTPPQRGGGAGARAGGAAPAAGAARAGGAPVAAPAVPIVPADLAIAEIPGVIAAGQRWRPVYNTTGNNADGPIAAADGGLMVAQNDNGQVLKIDANGNATVVYRDTNTGGALSMSTKGALFVASRGIGVAVLQLAPQRRVVANSFDGEPLECLGGVANDVSADSRGGVYFTMGGLFYIDPSGKVTRYGENLRTNGVILSPDERTVYVTNGQSIAAFDVRGDGSLANQREFAKLPAGGGDGLAVDSTGRLYATVGGGAGGARGVYVFAPDGKPLGHIDSPRPLITVAFAGADKKTLYGIANDRVRVDVYAIPMIAQGPTGRAK
jgi:gluconolactonase